MCRTKKGNSAIVTRKKLKIGSPIAFITYPTIYVNKTDDPGVIAIRVANRVPYEIGIHLIMELKIPYDPCTSYPIDGHPHKNIMLFVKDMLRIVNERMKMPNFEYILFLFEVDSEEYLHQSSLLIEKHDVHYLMSIPD